MSRLSPHNLLVLVCDMQTCFRGKFVGDEHVNVSVRQMINIAKVLDVPVVVTEQYPEKLGPTVEEVKAILPPDTPILSKTKFSMLTPEMSAFLSDHCTRRQVVLVGGETHVCIWQTARDLVSEGYEVYIPTDAVSSQRALDRSTALRRLETLGCEMVTVEMVLFDLLEDKQHEKFRDAAGICRVRPEKECLTFP